MKVKEWLDEAAIGIVSFFTATPPRKIRLYYRKWVWPLAIVYIVLFLFAIYLLLA